MKEYFVENDNSDSDNEYSSSGVYYQENMKNLNNNYNPNLNLVIFVNLILLGFLLLDLTKENHKTIAITFGFAYMIFICFKPEINNKLLVTISNQMLTFSILVISFILIYIKIKFNLILFY